MTVHEIIITDVTSYGNLHCVAGWDRISNRMVRPEPPDTQIAIEASRFWSEQWAGPGKFFAIGNVVRIATSPPPVGSTYPHATEDRIVVNGEPRDILDQLQNNALLTAIRQTISASASAAFGNALVRAGSGKAYVLAGNNGPSLGAVEKKASEISFYENNDRNKTKLRVRMTDGGNSYDFSAPASAALAKWRAGGLCALEEELNAGKKIHVRLGLSRPMPILPDRCYAQINGFLFG